jgi:hypothetical protein
MKLSDRIASHPELGSEIHWYLHRPASLPSPDGRAAFHWVPDRDDPLRPDFFSGPIWMVVSAVVAVTPINCVRVELHLHPRR